MFSFDSGGPAILKSLPADGEGSIDEQSAFILALDAPTKPETIEAIPAAM